jgi:hypothetical protein
MYWQNGNGTDNELHTQGTIEGLLEKQAAEDANTWRGQAATKATPCPVTSI